MSVYLAGPISGCTELEMFDWRRDLIRRMPNTTFADPTVRDYRGIEDANVVAIVEQDKADIDGCEIVVAYCPRPSVGTSMEVLYAWERSKHVIVWVPPGAPVSPWLRYHSHGVYQYAFEVESAIAARLLGVSCSTSPTPAATP
jgi:nucleoside 2-deoxyribosyltransferase